ncbi:hypothetical protein NLI96_g5868 [Meripilus lineatus]|uniref:Uncharacterized protein n=1 Tax=Meripilus lineatus TaxID=2056292 RepID=A0AAD5YGJ0_9APHY|nr:hypothetical protein NLI96_g5868 [Physisporinus lineatus]
MPVNSTTNYHSPGSSSSSAAGTGGFRTSHSHRKRVSALRLSSDSTSATLPALPLYTTSPPWSTRLTPVEFLEIPSDRPPDYSDSAEEADADTDGETSDPEGTTNTRSSRLRQVYVPSSDTSTSLSSPQQPPLSFSPRRSNNRRTHTSNSSRSSISHSRRFTHRGDKFSTATTSSSATTETLVDPYLDSLLARSVHALEMSNALLQSSMTTTAPSNLADALSSDGYAHSSLEVHAQKLSARIHGNGNVQDSWMGNLEEIYKGVESLVGGGDESETSNHHSRSHSDREEAISQSLPTNGLPPLVDRVKQSSPHRRPSLDFRSFNSSSSDSQQLNFSNHNRRDLVAPAPRALTMYVDSTDDPSLITLPQTLGLRSSTQIPPTPLPSQTFIPQRRYPDEGLVPVSNPTSASSTSLSMSTSPPKRAVDLLASYISRTTSSLIRRSSTGSTATLQANKAHRSKSPPHPHVRTPISLSQHSTPSRRSRSLTPIRGNSPSPVVRQQQQQQQHKQMTLPIEDLSTSSSSESSHSDTLHVDKTLESLRSILEKQPPRPASTTPSMQGGGRSRLRPAFLIPPNVEPMSSTSTATASVSRLFTKGRHSSSTRPPSPPRHSSMKSKSQSTTPSHTPSPSVSMLSVSDVIVSGFGFGSGGSSGGSTPKRISFAELPEPSGRTRLSSYSRSSKRKGKFKHSNPGNGNGNGHSKQHSYSDDDLYGGGVAGRGGGGWLYELLLSAAAIGGGGSVGGNGSGGGSVTSPRSSGSFVRQDERFSRYPAWANRPGFGSSVEDWAV